MIARKKPLPWSSFVDWASSPAAGAMVDHRPDLASEGAYAAKVRFHENISDPPVQDLVISLMVQGWGKMGCDLGFGRIPTQEIVPGRMTLAPAGVSAEGWGSGNVEVMVLALPWDRYRPLLEASSKRSVPHFGELHSRVLSDERARLLLQSLWIEAEARDGGKLYADGLILALLGRFLTLAGGQLDSAAGSMSSRAAVRAKDYIMSKLGEDLSLADIASVVGYSPSHLARLFRATFGESTYAFVLRMRLERAVELMQTTRISAEEVANQCGFYDSSHLNRQLRRRCGAGVQQIRR